MQRVELCRQKEGALSYLIMKRQLTGFMSLYFQVPDFKLAKPASNWLKKTCGLSDPNTPVDIREYPRLHLRPSRGYPLARQGPTSKWSVREHRFQNYAYI